ncbi:uncharacterized protein Z519_09185 [Cladophialophora bantiana CBS 173.52]|uniref:Uncharacterized protein n=1 Tax=Cladophialophora bantiana (strain ATCC 10958 / CBS 173.52 / CDC B-1940 / NIH 8579) TaxID=1442370 RepID=A0A0D2HBE9_CLAB1|nr:uncharacterized protein Z519_09185 [Cladophialophora bantiana CBS 173.52]KIW90538.1 hypothetical protein Z519_09185 [Cladophialophora bantiana CBS 173.52]
MQSVRHPQPTFILQQTSSSLAAENGTYTGLSSASGSAGSEHKVFFGLTTVKVSKFTLNKACGLVDLNHNFEAVANIHLHLLISVTNAATLFLDAPVNVMVMDYAALTCDIAITTTS